MEPAREVSNPAPGDLVAAFGLGMHEAAPDASLPYGGLWDGVPIRDGRVQIPSHEGAGYEAKTNLLALLQPLSALP